MSAEIMEPAVVMFRNGDLKGAVEKLEVLAKENKDVAMIHHTYNLLGYTLIFDETTVFHTLSEPVESAEPQQTTITHDEENLNEVELPSKTQGRQSKLDVLGMEVA